MNMRELEGELFKLFNSLTGFYLCSLQITNKTYVSYKFR